MPQEPKVAEVLPLVYLHGLSTGDFVPALEAFFGSGAGLSAAVITRLVASPPGRPTTRPSAAVTWPPATMCTSGPMESTSGCGWSRPGCAAW